jgi:acyl-coenzyme A synthetase/AMP-(fatty) acid ligase
VGGLVQFVLRGPHVAEGYWRDDASTSARFKPTPDGGRELWTGDYGRVDADGYLYFVGRRDDIFKRNGVRVSTTEIEAAALDIPGVRAAAALAPHGPRGLIVYVVTEHEPEHIMRGLRGRLEPAKTPDACQVVADLPVTSTGKIDKKALAASADRSYAEGVTTPARH